MTSALTAKFRVIKKDHKAAIRRRVARVSTVSSVIRVFEKGSKGDILRALDRIDLDGLTKVRTQSAFDRWFRKSLNTVSRAIALKNRRNKRILPGLKWGHSTKVLCIFVREIVLHSRYLPSKVVDRIEPFLYVPVDSVVMGALKDVGVPPPFKRIREIEKPADFYWAQNVLGAEAAEVGVPRVWFDDVWVER